MVAMQVGDKNSLEALMAHFALHKATLGALPTIEQVLRIAHSQDLSRLVPVEKWRRRRAAQDFQLKLQVVW